jgi:hypothetical protein
MVTGQRHAADRRPEIPTDALVAHDAQDLEVLARRTQARRGVF